MNTLRSRPGMPEALQTSRLLIRKWRLSDAIALHEAVLTSHKHLFPWLPWMREEPIGLEERKELIELWDVRFRQNIDYPLGIFDRQTGRVIGGTGLHPRGRNDCTEVGYWVRVDEQGRGYIKEAAIAMTKLALGYLHYPRFEIRCDPRNLPSSKVAAGLGLTLEGVLRHSFRDTQGLMRDTEVWSLLLEEYKAWPHRTHEVEALDTEGTWRKLR